MMKHKLSFIVGPFPWALLVAAPLCQAQTVADLYRITAGVSRCHVEYHRLEMPKGKETVLADLAGPGKVTSTVGCLQMERGDNRMYRWYIANPVRFQQALKVQIQNQHDNGTPTAGDADDYTSVAFWYQENPHATFTLQTFLERTAPRRAGRSK